MPLPDAESVSPNWAAAFREVAEAQRLAGICRWCRLRVYRDRRGRCENCGAPDAG